MSTEENKLKTVWEESNKTAIESTKLPIINFNDLISSLVSLGPFYLLTVPMGSLSKLRKESDCESKF
jgi:hypothetical protein